MSALSPDQIFNLWSPHHSPWSNWVKPTLFAALENFTNVKDDETSNMSVEWQNWLQPNQAIVVDLPSSSSIRLSLPLIEKGFHPIPLFNSCLNNAMVVKADSILLHLTKGAEFISRNPIRQNPMPLFLLDSNRMGKGLALSPNLFDNRWLVLPQDMPSGDALLSNGVNQVLVVNSDPVSEDLCHILKRYQEKRIQIQSLNINTNVKADFTMPPLLRFKSVWYRIFVFAGLRKNSAGGFGSIIPMPSSSHG